MELHDEDPETKSSQETNTKESEGLQHKSMWGIFFSIQGGETTNLNGFNSYEDLEA